jgi:hypothetical protein
VVVSRYVMHRGYASEYKMIIIIIIIIMIIIIIIIIIMNMNMLIPVKLNSCTHLRARLVLHDRGIFSHVTSGTGLVSESVSNRGS